MVQVQRRMPVIQLFLFDFISYWIGGVRLYFAPGEGATK